MSFLIDVKNKFLSVFNLFKPTKSNEIKDLAKIEDYYKNLSKKPPKINKKFR